MLLEEPFGHHDTRTDAVGNYTAFVDHVELDAVSSTPLEVHALALDVEREFATKRCDMHGVWEEPAPIEGAYAVGGYFAGLRVDDGVDHASHVRRHCENVPRLNGCHLKHLRGYT